MNEDNLTRYEKQSMLLGMAYGSICALLTCHESQLYIKLLELKQQLSKGIEEVYYQRPKY